MPIRIRSGPLALASFGCALLAVILGGEVAAAEKPGQPFIHHLALDRQKTGQHYFIDFRSRSGYVFGHTFIVYGRLDARGQSLDFRYAGLYPLDGRRGLIVGSVVPVPASVRSVEEDFTHPATNVYRRDLTAAEYARLTGAVGYLRATERKWSLLFFNCNDFAIRIGKELGLRTPPSWLLPKTFVAGLRHLNEP